MARGEQLAKIRAGDLARMRELHEATVRDLATARAEDPPDTAFIMVLEKHLAAVDAAIREQPADLTWHPLSNRFESNATVAARSSRPVGPAARRFDWRGTSHRPGANPDQYVASRGGRGAPAEPTTTRHAPVVIRRRSNEALPGTGQLAPLKAHGPGVTCNGWKPAHRPAIESPAIAPPNVSVGCARSCCGSRM